MNAISNLHKEIDRLTELLSNASAKNGRPITCNGRGCCACCYEPVYCSDAEAAHIIELLDDKQRSELKHLLLAAIGKAKSAGLFDLEMPPVMDWLAAKIRCPFLVDGICSIYDRRPVSCRSHIASRSPDFCKYNRLEQRYPISTKINIESGKAILNCAFEIGKSLVMDNMLTMLYNELVEAKEYTASARTIVFQENERTE